MTKKIIRHTLRFLTQKQGSIFSAATIIMVMVALSRILGLVRNRVLAHFFSADDLAVYLAAFRIPEVVFEVLIFGTLSSAFIPVFVNLWAKKKSRQAWKIAAISFNLVSFVFLCFGTIIFIFAKPFYSLIAAGFSPEKIDEIVLLSRLLILAQGFFLVSYFLTAILESLQRFLLPAITPLFYNLGIIISTLIFHSRFGILAPTLGALFGAFLHFAVQLPFVFRLGFRFRKSLQFSHPEVKKITRLALPRVLELSVLQVLKSVELLLASLVSSGAYTYLTFADNLRLLPISLFGASIAKASLPVLAYSARRKKVFKKIFLASFEQIIFFTIPLSVFLAVLRIPLVRLIYGAARFDWQATLETSYALSVFCLGIFAHSLVYLLNRSFYALKNTRLPVVISISSFIFNIALAFFFLSRLHLPVWGLALASSLSSLLQALFLFICLHFRLRFDLRSLFASFAKIMTASLLAGTLMFLILKFFDRSVWQQELFFPRSLSESLLPLKSFFVDTRYVFNLFLITVLDSLFGLAVYLCLCWLFKLNQLPLLLRFLSRFKLPHSRLVKGKQEVVSSTHPEEGDQL